MRNVVWVKSANGIPRYIGLGSRPGQFYSRMKYLSGHRGFIEMMYLRLPKPITAGRIGVSRDILDDLEELSRFSPLAKGLFLWTDYYKATRLVGVFSDVTGMLFFCKIFKDPSDRELESVRVAQLSNLLPAGARPTEVIYSTGRVVVYNYEKSRVRGVDFESLRQVALALGHIAVDRSGQRRPTRCRSYLAEVVTSLDLGNEMAVERCLSILSVSESFVAVAHGDFTPRNCLVHENGDFVVLDYENVGVWPVYYDLVHLEVQQSVESGLSVDIARLAQRLRVEGVGSAVEVVETALAWDINETARLYLEHPMNRVRTAASLSKKLAILGGESECI